ncbi:unnamed protein product [Rotaria sordida]|uniref:Uncharacterized protein n=1 Tax=Rotaria sordida TaxID=392033 RepID=A0A814F7J5_9BILA|nr:unnamed protein product [Rotaria sordida]CAF3803806.1 unnamed protein product [Rotaria sordida]
MILCYLIVYEENHEFEPSDSQKLTSHQTINRDDDDSNDHNLSIFKPLLHHSNDPILRNQIQSSSSSSSHETLYSSLHH